MSDSITDRRRTGIHRTMISNGNGEKLDLITVTASRIRVIVGAILATASLIAIIFGAVRFGIVTEVHAAIDAATTDDRGIIRREIRTSTEEQIQAIELTVREDLKEFDGRLTDIQIDLGGQIKDVQNDIENFLDQQKRDQSELKMLLERAIRNDGGSE